MTNREISNKINELIESIPNITDKDKSKIYSWKEILNFNKKEIFEPEKGGFSLKWCDECKSFLCHRGNSCQRCKSNKTGLGNPIIHAKTIKSQIEKGTFNMLNKEIQSSKISNKNLIYKDFCLYCYSCKKLTNHRVWDSGVKQCRECNFKKNGMNLCFCDNCNKYTLHNSSICTVCNPESKTSGIWYEEKYCDICNQIQLFMYGKYCRKHSGKCGNIILPNFEEHEKIICNLHLNERVSYKCKCWSCLKQENKNKYNSEFINEIKLNYKESFIQSTFRKQESENWGDNRLAFEQSLIDNGIFWFVYIKFYIDENNSLKPLVVGKSGSLLVNYCGSDLIFSTNIKHGPARKFLKDLNYNWDKTKILVIPSNFKQSALDLEKEIQIKYNLFGS